MKTLTDKTVKIPLGQLTEREGWNRPLETADADLEVLEASMARMGQLEPIVVRPLGRERYEVVSGHRRLAAARRLKWKELAARVVEMDDNSVQGWGFATNYARKPIGIFWEAVEVRRLLALGKSKADVAAEMGHSVTWVERRLALNLDACRRFAEEVLKELDIPIEKVHASNLEFLGEFSDSRWQSMVWTCKNWGEHAARHLAEQGSLSRELWSVWTRVQGKPWAGAQVDGEKSIPACEECPHFGGKLAVLFPELEAVRQAEGCCAQYECIKQKRLLAQAAARQEILSKGWKASKIRMADKVRGGLAAWTKCKQRQAEVAIIHVDDKSGTWGFYRKIQELPKEAEPGSGSDGPKSNWSERQKGVEGFKKLVVAMLNTDISARFSGVDLPEGVISLVNAVCEYFIHDQYSVYNYCNWPLTRHLFDALMVVLLGAGGAKTLKTELLEFVEKAELEVRGAEEEDDDEEADEEEDQPKADEDTGEDGERCVHCGEDGYCANESMNGGGFVCCHCAGFEPAKGDEVAEG